jgi:hypothetical protein
MRMYDIVPLTWATISVIAVIIWDRMKRTKGE